MENITNFLLNQTHILIAGCTGSGKSALINDLIYNIITAGEKNARLILIDPKRVELNAYKSIEKCELYASEPADILNALEYAVNKMENVYKYMQLHGLKKSPFAPVYIIIDEYADLVTTQKKAVEPLIFRLAQLGRAAKFRLIFATQRPTREVMSGRLTVNIDCKVALRTVTARDSMNIIQTSGAEKLPRFGYGLVSSPDLLKIERVQIPFIPDAVILKAINEQPKKLPAPPTATPDAKKQFNGSLFCKCVLREFLKI